MAKPSFVTTDLDFDVEGVQISTLRMPYSHDRSAYGHIPVPIFTARWGDGPTVLLTGGVHGDENEVSLFLYDLIRQFDVDWLRGRIIVIPALNLPAFQAARPPCHRLNRSPFETQARQ